MSINDQLWDIVVSFLDAKHILSREIADLAARARVITDQPDFDWTRVDPDTWAGISVLLDVAKKGESSDAIRR